MTTRRWQWVCITVVLSPYVWSFFMPAMAEWFGPPGAIWTGWDLFLIGVHAPLVWCWWPNPLLLIGLLMLIIRRNRTALILGSLATLVACLCGFEFWEALYPGYLLWLASMVLLAFAGGFLTLLNRTQKPWLDSRVWPTAIMDASAADLFHQPQKQSLKSAEIRSDPIPANRPASVQTPCSPSSSA